MDVPYRERQLRGMYIKISMVMVFNWSWRCQVAPPDAISLHPPLLQRPRSTTWGRCCRSRFSSTRPRGRVNCRPLTASPGGVTRPFRMVVTLVSTSLVAGMTVGYRLFFVILFLDSISKLCRCICMLCSSKKCVYIPNIQCLKTSVLPEVYFSEKKVLMS